MDPHTIDAYLDCTDFPEPAVINTLATRSSGTNSNQRYHQSCHALLARIAARGPARGAQPLQARSASRLARQWYLKRQSISASQQE